MVSETKIARKLDAIFAIPIGPTMDSPSLFRWLHAAFDEYLILASRDPDRGIDRVDFEVDGDYPDVAILRLTNEPHDARLRAYYSALGFLHGEILPLDDRGQLEILFIAIDRFYTRFGLDLAAPPP